MASARGVSLGQPAKIIEATEYFGSAPARPPRSWSFDLDDLVCGGSPSPSGRSRALARSDSGRAKGIVAQPAGAAKSEPDCLVLVNSKAGAIIDAISVLRDDTLNFEDDSLIFWSDFPAR